MGYENGGLKMIDLDKFVKVIKICWIKRMMEAENDSILNRIYVSTFDHLGVLFCLKVISLKTTFVNLRKIDF